MPAPKKAAQPQDHRKPKAERENELFEWEFNGDSFTLPPGAKLKAGVLRRASKQSNEVGQVFAILEEIAAPEALAIIDEMPLDELGEMFLAWQNHSGASLGESRSSSN
jgi:hypothetical protein